MPTISGAARKQAGAYYDWGGKAYHTKHPNSGLICDGVADEFAALNLLANTTLQPAGGVLDVVGVLRVGSDLTIPDNITLNFVDGAYLAPDVNKTVTIAGRVKYSKRKIFSGGGSVRFTETSVPRRVLIEWWGAVADGVTVCDTARDKAIRSFPNIGGIIHAGTGTYKFTTSPSADINNFQVVTFEGNNTHSFAGNGAPTPVLTVFDVGALNTYWFSEAAASQLQQWGMIGICFDGKALSTCPGVVNCNDEYQIHPVIRDVLAVNFMRASTNALWNDIAKTGGRAIFDMKTVDGFIERLSISGCPNARAISFNGSTSTKVVDLNVQMARECVAVNGSVDIEFIKPRWENSTTVGSFYYSSYVVRNGWMENVGYNLGTHHVGGISQRNGGLTFVGGTLGNPAVANPIMTPIFQLYGSGRWENTTIQAFATGGNDFTAAAWFEVAGQSDSLGTDLGGSIFISGKKYPDATPLFAATDDFGDTERGPLFTIGGEDTWSTGAGSGGGSLFRTGANQDYRKFNWCPNARITMNDGAVQVMRVAGGKLIGDVQDANTRWNAIPAATTFPQGGQWEQGDALYWGTPIPGDYLGASRVVAGTATSGWNYFGALELNTDWVPTFKFNGLGAAQVYGIQAARAMKSGKKVTLTGIVVFSGAVGAKGTSVGNATIEGIPYPVKNAIQDYVAVSTRINGISYVGMVQAYMAINTSVIILERVSVGGVVTPLANGDFSDSAAVAFNVTYETT